MRTRSRTRSLSRSVGLIALAVAAGTFNADASAQRVMFTRKTGRYVRFVALSEIGGNAWTSVAELRMVGGSP
jgi:hypothetical protein